VAFLTSYTHVTQGGPRAQKEATHEEDQRSPAATGAGLTVREIARSTGAGRTTVFEYLVRADAAGLTWPCHKAWATTRSKRCCSAGNGRTVRAPARA